MRSGHPSSRGFDQTNDRTWPIGVERAPEMQGLSSSPLMLCWGFFCVLRICYGSKQKSYLTRLWLVIPSPELQGPRQRSLEGNE